MVKSKIIIELVLILFTTKEYLIRHLKQEIETDNIIKIEQKEHFDFSEYLTTIKPIVIYKSKKNSANVDKNIYKESFNKADNKIKELTEQINFIESHGIYGFAFYYFFYGSKNNSNNPIDIILKNKNLKVHFMLIINNITENSEININMSEIYFDIKKYIVDKRYIKFYNKSIVIINRDNFDNNFIIKLRENLRADKFDDIYILSTTNDYNNSMDNNFLFDGTLYSPSYESLEKIHFKNNNTLTYFYTQLLYKNLLEPPINNGFCFRISIPLSEYPFFLNRSQSYIFGDYSPDKYYFLNKIIIDWTKSRYDKNNQFIFINDFNNLQYDENFGYANINSLSKALYGLPLLYDSINNININILKKAIFVLIQAHIYYTELIEEIINKTNNIPVPFDLYITTNTQDKKFYIENYVKNNSKANKYEVLVTPNKGRDVMPCLIQLKDILKRYKYLCHIHTKKHDVKQQLGKAWQHYLYENLLGDKNIINQILSDFEKYDKLGFIFPEHYISLIKYAIEFKTKTWNNIDKIFDILFPNFNIKAGNIMNFPAGNMFWAKTKAIYQIFNEKIINLSPKERGQIDCTILHAIERIWLYLVKLNGFYYKTIFYSI